ERHRNDDSHKQVNSTRRRSWLLLLDLADSRLQDHTSPMRAVPALRQVTEEDSTTKRAADALPGYALDKSTSHPLAKIQRVKQSKLLPVVQLHQTRRRGGTTWLESSGDCYYQQRYWNDEAAYVIQSANAQRLRDATYALHAMCLEAVDLVVQSDDLMEVFEIPDNMRAAVRWSWQRRYRDLLGLFDFSWDGQGDPKLLAYNADAPTILVEMVVGQRLWWDHQEHAAFVAKTAAASGIAVTLAGMDQLSVANSKVVTTWDNTPVPCVWKLYPYEWLAEESLGIDLFADDGSMSSTFVDKQRVVAKPKYGREGTGVVYSHEFDNPHEFLTAAIDAATVSLPAEGNTLDRVANLFGHTNQDPTLYLGHPVYQAYHETATGASSWGRG
ncbi:hypothetical protein DYB30_011734, partial [Aphanomyces astaci]